MASNLLQIKVDPSLKAKLQRVALSKGLNMTSYIKMTLIAVSDQDEDLVLTENGFTLREERRLLKSIREGEREYKEKKLESYNSMEDALSSLDE